MQFRLNVASIVLLVAAISAVGCEDLLPADDPVPIPTRDVLVAAQAIEEGTSIGPEMITMRTVPLDDTNSMAFEEVSEAVGKVAAIDILEWQLITPNLLEDE